MLGARHTSRGGGGRLYSIGTLTAAVCAIALALTTAHATAAAGPYLLKSHLKRPASTVGAPRATGALSGVLKLAGADSSFTWTLKFSHLSGSALHAGIYLGKEPRASQLAILLCNRCSSGAVSYYHGSYVASPTFVHEILQGRAYMVIQTKKNPEGEIRGRINATVT